jgi:DNA mismatch endonuclease Vsr
MSLAGHCPILPTLPNAAMPSISHDTLSAAERSQRMALIRGRDTKPELVVRKAVFGMGYRYRLHGTRLPGCPDLIFRSRRAVIFVPARRNKQRRLSLGGR